VEDRELWFEEEIEDAVAAHDDLADADADAETDRDVVRVVLDVGTLDNGSEARTSTFPMGLTKRNQAVFDV